MKIPLDWHKTFYDNSFYNPASPAAVAQAPEEVEFILKKLGLNKGAKVLDLCCGPGRHAVPLARKGLAVTGYDFSADYLKEAAAGARKAGVKLTLKRGDMRSLKFKGEFDAVVNLFTSFGYFHRISDDIKTLKGVARALKPGGLFLLDVLNGGFIRGHFVARDWEQLEDGSYYLRERELTKDGINNSWTRIGGRKTERRRFFARLYSKTRITQVLRRAGLVPIKFWGSFSGAPLDNGAPRLIVLSRKAGLRA